jgi:DNA-binding NtrC family response regulator
MNNIKILIVDDEEDLRINLSRLLEDSVESVTAVENGAEALKLLKNGEEFACIISDSQRPVMGAVELIKELRTFDAITPFVFFTAHGNRELMMKAVQYGAFDFINKPHFDNLSNILGKITIHHNQRLAHKETGHKQIDLIEEFNKIKLFGS